MPLEKALITNTVTSEQIPVMFNPDEYTLSSSVNFAHTPIPGLSAPHTQFVNGALQTLSMALSFDTYERHERAGTTINMAGDDVRKWTRKVTDLMRIDRSTHAPPVLVFTWASLAFTCVLAQAAQRFTAFLPDGTPVRASLQVTFNEYVSGENEAREIKRETSDYSKVEVVGQGDTLSAISYRTMGDPGLWRAVALRNDIDDPRRLAIGQILAIPRLPYLDRETGRTFR